MKSDIEKAANLTKQELAFINGSCERLFTEAGQRPIVYIARCAHILGTVIFGSNGTLSKDLIVELVKKTIQL
jgi:hypothetical protein